jgi:hypothetical protein
LIPVSWGKRSQKIAFFEVIDEPEFVNALEEMTSAAIFGLRPRKIG